MASTNCWTKERFNLLHLTPFTSSSFSLCSFSRWPLLCMSFSLDRHILLLLSSSCFFRIDFQGGCCNILLLWFNEGFFFFFLDCLYTQWNPFCTLRQPVSHCMHFTSSLCAKVYCTNGQKKTCSRYIWIWKIISCSNQSFYVWLHVCLYGRMAACACMGSA